MSESGGRWRGKSFFIDFLRPGEVKAYAMHSGKGVRPPTQMRELSQIYDLPPTKGSERHLLRCTSWPLASARLKR